MPPANRLECAVFGLDMKLRTFASRLKDLNDYFTEFSPGSKKKLTKVSEPIHDEIIAIIYHSIPKERKIR